MSLPEILDIAASVFSYFPKLCRDVSVVWICSLLIMCFWGSRALCELGIHWRCSPPSCLRPLRGGSLREHSTHLEGRTFSFHRVQLHYQGIQQGPARRHSPPGTTEFTVLPVAQRAFVSAPSPVFFIGYACFSSLLQFLDYCSYFPTEDQT